MKNKCFVCSIPAAEFQRDGGGFENHVNEEHNLWNYLFFLVHLELKDTTEYTSHESYVFEHLEDWDLSFFPINRAIALKDRNDKVDDVGERIKRLEDKIVALAFSSEKEKKELLQAIQLQQTLLASQSLAGVGDVEPSPSTASPIFMAAMASTKLRHMSNQQQRYPVSSPLQAAYSHFQPHSQSHQPQQQQNQEGQIACANGISVPELPPKVKVETCV